MILLIAQNLKQATYSALINKPESKRGKSFCRIFTFISSEFFKQAEQ
ncbi:hypothetical protein NIASO_12750 [Niabella soli DSM 19437]|uniref:Uncharacterized protein n=1 Tax=Niabella soli DSM 19437 TaxID=929713 RepID=W0F8M2_9BACT|nr:hypothetical protein NIASO_12750 [Niabella soli DSM 19437]